MPGIGTSGSTVPTGVPAGGLGGAAATTSFRVLVRPPTPGSAVPTHEVTRQFLEYVVMFLMKAISRFSPGLSYICGFMLFQPVGYSGFTNPVAAVFVTAKFVTGISDGF